MCLQPHLSTSYYVILMSKMFKTRCSLAILPYFTKFISKMYPIKILFYFFYCCSSTVVSIFLPPLPPPHPLQLPTLNPSRLWLCPWVLYTCSLTTLPLLSLLTPFPLPSGYCQFVLYFNVSGYVLLACLFILLIRFHL